VGGVLIGEATFRRLPAGTLAERLPPLRVKGKEEEVEAYLLRAVGTGAPKSDHEQATDGDAEDDPEAD
jgi:class 3 adenylate cyclase